MVSEQFAESTRGRPAGNSTISHSWMFPGRPSWFTTIFVVDMWERFSFYGMTAILYLHLVAAPADGGHGMAPSTAAAVFGSYMAMAFLAALPGGWLCDRLLGARRAVLIGGSLIGVGHLALATPVNGSLYTGLVLIVVGTGLVKPSIAAIVSSQDTDHNERREAAFSLFYMSIQVSALVAPVATGILGEQVNWHLGFGIAAAGMLVGLAHFGLRYAQFAQFDVVPTRPLTAPEVSSLLRRGLAVVAVVAVLFAADVVSGAFEPTHVLAALGLVSVALPVLYIHRLLRTPSFTRPEVDRLRAFSWLLLASAVFWALYGQSGSVMTGFAQDDTDRVIGGFEIPASWFQSAHPLFILLLAPAFAWLWVRLGKRVSTPLKFAAALTCGGLAFLVMAAAEREAADGPVAVWWLLAAFLLQVCGELALAPIGLAMAAQVAPPGYTNQLLGSFWLFAALGVGVGGQLAGLLAGLPGEWYFAVQGLFAIAVAAVLAGAARSVAARLS